MSHHITLFGEVLADVFLDQTILGGAPYNVTRHLQAFQQHPVLISKVGNDSLKEKLFTELSKLKINVSSIQIDEAYPTGQVTVTIENGVHHFDICLDQAYDYIEVNQMVASTKSTRPDIIYFGTLAQRNTVSKAALKTLLTGASCTKFLDINLRAPWYNRETIAFSLLNADIVKVSDEELSVVAKLFTPNISKLEDIAFSLIEQFGLTTLYITCGEDGAWAFSIKGESFQVRSQALGPLLVDTVGAGDAFSAIAILGILYGWSVKKTLYKADGFAKDVCKIRGAAPDKVSFYSLYSKWLNE